MKHLVTLVSILFFMLGCAKKEMQIETDPVLTSKEIVLFKQSLPIKKEVLSKAYKKISPIIGLNNLRELKGTSFNGEFVFNEQKLPFIEYRFDKPYIIKKIYLKKSGFVVDGDASSSNIKKYEILFLDAKKSPHYRDELSKGSLIVEDVHNVQAGGFILKTRSVYTPENEKIDENDVVAAFDGRIEVEVIDVDYIYDIVAPVLSERDADTSNEELLQTIALLNGELFRRLRDKRADFNLPKTSVLYLPDDADMHYAVAHTQDIYETGKYKTVNGEYKIFIFSENAEFDSKGKVRVKKHTIKIKDSNRNLKTTTQLPEHEDFIDFSEGI